MNSDIEKSTSSKFTFILKGFSQKSKLNEVKSLLKTVYPFEVLDENILICKTNEKYKYDIYVSKNPILIKKNKTTRVLGVIFLILIVLLSFFVINRKTKALKLLSEQKRELQIEQEKSKRKQEELYRQLELLKEQYEKLRSEEYSKIYPELKYIYKTLIKGTIIESLFIGKNDFTIEVTTSDALKILQNIETNSHFYSVKMTRSSVSKMMEYVVFTGKLRDENNAVEVVGEIEQQLNFYKNKISKKRERIELLKQQVISDYIKNIRLKLQNCGCVEKLIQLKGANSNLEIEYTIESSSKAILSFLELIQKGDNNLVDIKAIVLKNSEESDKVKTVLTFNTGIELKSGEEVYQLEYDDDKVSINDLNSVLLKKQKKVTSDKKQSEIENKKNVQVTVNFQNLSYIGLTRIGAKTIIIAKDESFNVLRKLPLVLDEEDTDCCWETNSGYKAKINNVYYEIKK